MAILPDLAWPRAGSGPRSEPHDEPVHIAPRPSSLCLPPNRQKGCLLPYFYFGATGMPGRLSEGLLLRRLQTLVRPASNYAVWLWEVRSLRVPATQ
jgi:hypothetical protein